MDIKKLLMGGIVGGILFFLLGWLAYVKLFAEFFKNHPGLATNLDKADMLLVYIAAGNLLHGFALSFVFVKIQTLWIYYTIHIYSSIAFIRRIPLATASSLRILKCPSGLYPASSSLPMLC